MRFKEILWENNSLRQTIFKNTFWLFAGRIISWTFKFFLIVYAARVLGVSVFGSFSFALSFTALTFLLSDFGVNVLMIREFSKTEVDKRELISTSFYLKSFIIILSFVATLVLSSLNRDSVAASISGVILGLYVVDAFRDFFTSIARAEEKMQFESYANIIEAFLATVIGIVFLYFRGTVLSLALAYLLGAGSSLILIVFLTKGYVRDIFTHFNRTLAMDIFVVAWPFAFASLVGFSLTQIDIVMLGWLRDPISVGEYTVGARIIQVLLVIPGLIGAAILPAVSRLVADKEKVAGVLKKAISFALFVSIPIGVGGFLLSSRIISAVFGNGFSAGATPFSIMLFTLVIFSVTTLLDYLLLAFNLQVKDMQYTSIAAGLNIILNFFFIKQWGIDGAAAATTISQFLNLALTASLSNRTLAMAYFPLRQTLYYVVAAIAMAVPIGVFWSHSIWILVPSSALVYFLALYILRAPVITDAIELLSP